MPLPNSNQIQLAFRIVSTLDDAEILGWLRELRLRAYVPESGYKVAAIMAMKRGDRYVLAGGVNVECVEHRLSMHGEGSAISLLATMFGKEILLHAGWTLGAPEHLTGPCDDKLADLYGYTCGACRQQIAEFAAMPDMKLHSYTLNGAQDTKTLSTLLPDSFSFRHYNPDIANDVSAEKNFPDPATMVAQVMRQEAMDEATIFNWLDSLTSIDYASHAGQAVILQLSNGFYVAGVKVENAAFVGHGATQSAIGNAVTACGPIEIQAVYSLSKSKDTTPHPFPLSALQSLAEFVKDGEIPVTVFAADGRAETTQHPL